VELIFRLKKSKTTKGFENGEIIDENALKTANDNDSASFSLSLGVIVIVRVKF
jgi:hypothetical protein